MGKFSLVPDIAWIKRGVPKAVPEKIRLDQDQLNQLIQGGAAESCDDSDLDIDEENAIQNDLVTAVREPTCQVDADVDQEINEEAKYNLDSYDEPDDLSKMNPMSGISQFTSPLDDQYITNHVDSDEDEDKEDFQIKADDNLVVVAKINKEYYSLDVYVYNERDDDWYVHHDYMLSAPPLCLEPISYDPGSENRKGNLLAVGTMDSVVSIWDLDIANGVEPAVVLGKPMSEKKKNKQKRDGSPQFHKDAVLSLSWNKIAENVLASGSADETVILWDLEEAKPSSVLYHFDGKVQGIEWHPAEQAVLLSGTLKGSVGISDCRQAVNEHCRKWSFNAEVERLLWDHFNPFRFLVTTDDGNLYYIDSRHDGIVYKTHAHTGGAHSISQSFNVKGLLSTSGGDGELKIWKLTNDGFNLVESQNLGMGELYVTKFSPNSGPIVAVGGQQECLVRVIAVDKYDSVRSAFSQEGN